MELNLNNTVQITIVIGFAAGVVKLLIISPLQNAINTLNDSVKEMKKMLAQIEKDQKDIDKRLVVVEQSAKSAHHRVDDIKKQMEARAS